MTAFLNRSPLFMQVFVVMLAGVLTAQLVNFMLVLVVPPPTPPIYRVAEIAEALRTGKDTGTFMVTMETTRPKSSSNPFAQRITGSLARQLSVSEDSVRIDLQRPTRFGPGPEPRRLNGRPDGPPPMPRPERGQDVVFGKFEAALRISDSEWRIAKPVRMGLDPWQWDALFALLGAILVVVPFAWFLARRLTRPIDLFASAAERLGRDPLGPALALQGPREIAGAAAAFNAMQTRLKRYVEDRTMMIAAIAHDLRTPLTRLSFRMEGAPEPLRGKAETDIAEMKDMIAAALAFVKGMSTSAQRRRLDLRALVESVADTFADMGSDVTVEPGETVVIEGDTTGLKSMLSNLVGNAVKYGECAYIRLLLGERQVFVDIEDKGAGIPENKLGRVFEPFYRLEPSRNRETGGTGLGLASARVIARAHGGDITLSNRPDGGLLARVALPL